MTMALVAVALGMLVFLIVLVFLPKGKKPAPSAVMAEPFVPQYLAPQYAPAPQLTLRQQEIQEKVAVLTSFYYDKEQEQFKKKVVDEALSLLSEGK